MNGRLNLLLPVASNDGNMVAVSDDKQRHVFGNVMHERDGLSRAAGLCPKEEVMVILYKGKITL